ncbi:nuclear transport factor 2 family protein [Variovorax robiniae]|uniref:Nuclear transport factor 2 family protein n=1 Tax=Variovorax robiniae TaxID=1836199 RepID=A0ABU8X5Z0_9BURK
MTQTLDIESVRKIFSLLEHGYDAFFTHVADKVDWTVHGTHPLAGHFRTKREFIDATFARIARILRGGTQLRVVHVMTSGDWATVEMQSMATALNGMRFDNRYCWVVRFENDKIVQVRAYLDSALIQKLFDENGG